MAERIDTQAAQSAIKDSLSKTKEFDKVKIAKGVLRYNGRNVQTHAKAPTKKSCSCHSSNHLPRKCLVYRKKCVDCSKINHFREVGRSRTNITVHNTEQEPDQHNEKEDHIDTVNINSIIFNSKQSTITANLETSSSQLGIIIPYKVDTDSHGNIIPQS